MTAPTERHLEVLRFIIEHVENNGFQPSYGEIARHCGVSKTAIQNRINELVEMGLVELVPGTRERALRLKCIRFVAIHQEDESVR